MKLLIRLFLLLFLLLAAAGCVASPTTPAPSPAQTQPPASTVPAATPTTASTPLTAAPSTIPTEAVPPGDFENPVLKSNFPDPFLLQEGDTWYAYATNGFGRNVQLATSADLVDWKTQGDAMPSLAPWVKLNGSDVWAPEVMKIGDRYNLYYTARDKASGKQCVGVATSDKPQGKFKDTNKQALVCQISEGGTIDPDPFRDGDKLYLFFKNDGNCCGIATYISVQQLSPDGLSLVGSPVRLVRNDQPWEGIVIEAPTMVKHDNHYYLFFSANNYAGVEYAVGYAACESVTGPCKDAPENPILKSRMNAKPFVVGPGHQDVIDIKGQDWIVYHAWQILSSGLRSDTRQMWIDKLDWKDGKPVVEGPTTSPQPKP